MCFLHHMSSQGLLCASEAQWFVINPKVGPYFHATSIQTAVFGLFCDAGALWSLNINQYTDNIHEINASRSSYICTMDITIQYKQPTMQFELLACSICVDFACFYVEFAFLHYAKKVGSPN